MSLNQTESSELPVHAFLAHIEGAREQPLEDHLRAVARLTGKHASKIGLGNAGLLVGLLHDLGKYSASFQAYLRRVAANPDAEEPDAERGKIDHSTSGAQTIWRNLKPKGTLEGIAADILALCIASHHTGLLDCIAPDGADKLSARMAKDELATHLPEVTVTADPAIVAQYEQLLQDSMLVQSVRDAIARICQIDPSSSNSVQSFKIGLLVRFLFSCLIDGDRLDTADFANPSAATTRHHGTYTDWSILASRLETALAAFATSSAVDRLRAEVSQTCFSAAARPKGTYLLTVPTGGGKTLASLRFALNHAATHGMDRIIYISPYTSIIEQNAQVVRSILEPAGTTAGSILLEHHSNLTPPLQTLRNKVLSENWDAPVVFTTAVQFLEALFSSGTRSVRRMHQMANAVLVFDEIQTLPVRCVHIVNNALNFFVEQCGSTVLLCTATQPLLHKVDPLKGSLRLSENPELIPDVAALFRQLHRCDVHDRRRPGGWAHLDAAKLAVVEARDSGSCLVVVNTKREALSIFNECRAVAPDLPVYHLSTGMCPAHRLEILGRIKALCASRQGVICVSTQLIEAGVDISFGSAIRALAGLDSIAQAAGRCNRHGERTIGTVHVINLVGELPKALHEIRKAQEAAQRVLDENRGSADAALIDLSDTSRISRYFDYYFFQRRDEMDYKLTPQDAQRDDSLLNLLSRNSMAVAQRNDPPKIFPRQAFMTAGNAFQAIDAPTRGIIVPYTALGREVINDLCAAFSPEQQFALLKRAQRFTINVFPQTLERLQRQQAVHEVQEGTGVLYLEKQWYSDEFGLNEQGSEAMGFENA